MALNRKHSVIDTFVSYDTNDDQGSLSEQQWRLASLATNAWMNKLKPFFNGSNSDNDPGCYNRVQYIRGSCKALADFYKTEKEFLSKNTDSDITKTLREFRSSDIARAYRSPYGQTGALSILNSTIDDFIQIHEEMDKKRRELSDRLKKLSDQAKDKQLAIRQTMIDLRAEVDRAQRKLEAAQSSLKKSQSRSDRGSVANYEERLRELEENRAECESALTFARDTFATETYRTASEEHSITLKFFAEYLFEEQTFYKDIEQFLFLRIPDVQDHLDHDELAPSFRCDLAEHCLTRIQRPIAYPIETCIRLLENNLLEEGLFRIAPSHGKQKKLVTELDLQIIDRKATLQELHYDPHVAASTLKQYLRELPDCLLTDALLPQWNEVISLSSEEARLERIRQLINHLPEVNYNNLCYLVRFLSRVEEHSSQNKMTASNLGICIGCSLLYPKEQPLSTSLSNSYTTGSTILELMIIHHKQLFPLTTQGDNQTLYPPQPDIVQNLTHSKSRHGSNENLIDIQPVPVQASPLTRQKNPAPRRPPSQPVANPPGTIVHQQSVNEDIPKEGNLIELSVNQDSTVSSTNQVERLSRRNAIESDLSIGVPTLIPQKCQPRQRISNRSNERELFSRTEENESPPTSNVDVNYGKYIPELKRQMSNTGQNNHICDTTSTSPGEITQF